MTTSIPNSFTEEPKDQLRFLTCGSVDDGKSTLIGCLLYESHLLFEDQIQSLKTESSKKGPANQENLDYALLMDGLKAEREQGITIDVAYRYFETPKRKFVIADCPGHEQYTRNMVTGASNSDAAIILIDVRNGLTTQTRRHTYIISLLGIRHVIVAVNKMDLVNYNETLFNQIRQDFLAFSKEFNFTGLHFIPLSALKGDNVTQVSDKMPFYKGPALLPLLETLNIGNSRNLKDFRFSVYTPIRPNASFRGYAGTILSGIIHKGDRVCILPSGKTNKIKEIISYKDSLDAAFAPQTVTLTLTEETDVSTGNLIVHENNVPQASTLFRANLIWMDDEEINTLRSTPFLLRYGSCCVKAFIRHIQYKTDMTTLKNVPAEGLRLNEIASVIIETTQPVYLDLYDQNRAMGCFILINPITNATAGAGLYCGNLSQTQSALPSSIDWITGDITKEKREEKYRHAGGTILLIGEKSFLFAKKLEQRLFENNIQTYLVSVSDRAPHRLEKLADLVQIGRQFVNAGALFLTTIDQENAFEKETLKMLSPLIITWDHTSKADLSLSSFQTQEEQIETVFCFLRKKKILPSL